MHEADETLDLLCEGKLKVFQHRKGYRFSIDAILLANFIKLRKGERMLDIGTGCGIIPLYLSKRGYKNEMVGVEIQKDLFYLAEKNKRLNECENVEFIEGDIKKIAHDLKKRPFHVVVSNPPYVKKRTGRVSPNPSRLIARAEVELDLTTLLSISYSLLYRKGRLYLIYPVSRLSEFISLSKSLRLEPKRLRFVYSRKKETAVMFLAECVKDGGLLTLVEEPLYIYEDGTYTDEVSSYYRI